MPKFVIDTNVLIEAAKRHYRFEFCYGFWDFLESCFNEGMICSIDRVDREIISDPVRNWVDENLGESFFEPTVTDGAITKEYGKILKWVENQNFKAAAFAEFAKGADGWLIAYAKVNGYTVVTDESKDLAARKKVLIPVVCQHCGVKSTDTWDFLQTQGANFVSHGTR